MYSKQVNITSSAIAIIIFFHHMDAGSVFFVISAGEFDLGGKIKKKCMTAEKITVFTPHRATVQRASASLISNGATRGQCQHCRAESKSFTMWAGEFFSHCSKKGYRRFFRFTCQSGITRKTYSGVSTQAATKRKIVQNRMKIIYANVFHLCLFFSVKKISENILLLRDFCNHVIVTLTNELRGKLFVVRLGIRP